MSAVPREAWSRLTEGITSPILEWSWLELLESSGSISESTGWKPLHLTLWEKGELAAGAPLYLRSHSWGDFVYDFAFAQAANQLGFDWYPKLVGMSPVTPIVGWKILVAPGFDERKYTELWIEEAEMLAKKAGAVSVQLNFIDPAWFSSWNPDSKKDSLWHAWIHQNYLFENAGLRDFDSYLALFDKNQRRNIIREKRKFADQGLSLRIVCGEEIPSSWFPLMARLYDKTNSQFGDYAARFLTRDFFAGLDKIRDILVFSAAVAGESDEPLALGFLLRKKDVLVGRYWGEREWRDSQYFNVCYYGPIEWAIRQGICCFDPGAGSYLKTRRGFVSRTNLSLHRFLDKRAERLFLAFLRELNSRELWQIEALNAAVPFKSTIEKPGL
jgi:predicted N-acyltransferase